MHAGNQRANKAYIGWPQFSRCHIHQQAAGQQNIKRRLSPRRAHSAIAQSRIMKIEGFTQIVLMHDQPLSIGTSEQVILLSA